mgnify:CR=1 FL=1
MTTWVEPKTSFGFTQGSTRGTNPRMAASATEVSGSIDYESLNRRRFGDDLDFNNFYRSIADFIKARLGYPIVRVELTDFSICTCIDEAVSKMDYHAPDWTTQLMTFITEPNVSMYKLPKFVLNNFRYAAYKKTLLSVAQQSGTLEFDFFLNYFNQNFLFDDFSASDFLIMQMNLEQIRKILGRDGSFQVLNGEFLYITPTPRVGDTEEVAVEYKSLNAETLHHYYLSWIQRYSLAIAKGVLGQVRGKHKILPSPDGGTQLNGDQLLSQSAAEMSALVEELLNEIEEPPVFTLF